MDLKDEIITYTFLTEQDRQIIMTQLYSLHDSREIQYLIDVYIYHCAIMDLTNKYYVGSATVNRRLKNGLIEFEKLYPEIKELKEPMRPGEVAAFWKAKRKGEYAWVKLLPFTTKKAESEKPPRPSI